MTDDIILIVPAVSDDKISGDLVHLTEILMNQGAETTGGFLGGEYGYGAFFENDVFMMHPFCWCERDDCLWCLGCECEYTDDWQTLVKQCRKCSGEIEPAPNFLHKPSGTKVHWYKYIGRSMEVDLKGDWSKAFGECIASLCGDGRCYCGGCVL